MRLYLRRNVSKQGQIIVETSNPESEAILLIRSESTDIVTREPQSYRIDLKAAERRPILLEALPLGRTRNRAGVAKGREATRRLYNRGRCRHARRGASRDRCDQWPDRSSGGSARVLCARAAADARAAGGRPHDPGRSGTPGASSRGGVHGRVARPLNWRPPSARPAEGLAFGTGVAA